MYRKVLFAGALALVLPGCGSNVEPGFVAKQWAGEMRELQINPVFPPREDFQVGDIYLPAVPQDQVDDAFDEEGYLPISIWLMEAGGDGDTARDKLKTFYENRSTYPQTSKAVVDAVEQQNSGPSENGQNGGNGGPGAGGNGNNSARGSELSGPVPQPVLDCADVDGGSGDSCNIFTDDEETQMRRMRIVGFPTFLSTTITQGNLSAFVPVEAFSAALGLDFGDIEKVSVNVPVAESVGLPAIQALELAESSFESAAHALCQSKDGNPGRIRALLPGGQRVDGKLPEKFHALVVSEVFYTRAIEISIETQQSFGLGARLQTLAPSNGSGAASQAAQVAQQAGRQNSDNDDGAGGDGGGGDGGGPQQQTVPGAVETLDRLKKSTSDLPSAPGGSLQIVSVSDGNVGMRRMFDRPIAIGYRGLSLDVETSTCRVVGGTPANTKLPKASSPESS
jgi:hypothetical protein